MKTRNLFLALVICCLSLSCSKELPVAEEISDSAELYRPAPPAAYAGYTVDNQFGLKLYGAIYKKNPDKNLCVSPLSIRTALSLVANGLAGEDLQEILTALNLTDADIATVNEDYRALTDLLIKADPKITFEIANSFWYKEGIEVNPLFKADLKSYYDAEVFPVDFYDPGFLDQMNGWVSDKTHGKITEIIKQVPAGVLMNLTNVIYFNGEWTHKFNRNATKAWSFRTLKRTYTDCSVMVNIQPYRFYEHPLWYGLEMTYGSGNWAMYAFLPKQTSSLSLLTDWLIKNWHIAKDQFIEDQPIHVFFPQFTIEKEFDLIPFLREMGVKRIFESTADFSRIMKEPLWVGMVAHKTYIDVNEDGTEAAAATAVWGVGGGPSGLFFDHPFTYVIAERSTGQILFLGQVMDPSEH
jgi:serine protease inhibitor